MIENKWETKHFAEQKLRYKSPRRLLLYYENLLDNYKDTYREMLDYEKYYERGMEGFSEAGLTEYNRKVKNFVKALKRFKEKFPEFGI